MNYIITEPKYKPGSQVVFVVPSKQLRVKGQVLSVSTQYDEYLTAKHYYLVASDQGEPFFKGVISQKAIEKQR